jgi:hypothetical protein
VRTFAVEMDPFKVKPLRKHLAANAADGECTFVQAVIDYGTENDIYFAWMADKFLVPVSDTANAYGSGIVRSKDVAQHLGANNFMVLPSGENLVVVNPVRRIRLEEIGTQGPVDFLTMDVQGEELNVVSGGIAYLNGNVRVMHIATHSAHVESMLKTLLMEHGWKLNYEIPRETYHATEIGGVLFDDGIQCWINSRG